MANPPNPYDAHVGARLRACRTLAGYSQEKLGAMVSLSFQQIQKYEKGINRIGASRLQQFSQLLNVPPSYFFEDMPGASGQASAVPTMPADGGGGHDAVDTVQATGVTRETAVALVKNFSQIPDGNLRDRIYQLVKCCAEIYSPDEDAQPGDKAGHSDEADHAAE